MTRFFPFVLLTFGTVVLSGCATMGGMRTEPLDRGVAKVYEADLETAVRSTRKALLADRHLHIFGLHISSLSSVRLRVDDVEELDGSTWMFLAKTKSDDVLVRVIVQETAENEVTIRVVVKCRWFLDFDCSGDDKRVWSDFLFAQLALELTEKPAPFRSTI